MVIITVYKDGFDSMENRNPNYSEKLKVFITDKEKVAHLKASEYIRTLKLDIFLGYDGEVYPKIRTEKSYVE